MSYLLQKKGSYDYVGEDSSQIGEGNLFKDYLLSMLEWYKVSTIHLKL